MADDRKSFTMRMESNNYDKLRGLAKSNKRSMAMELEYIIEQYFENYESQCGQIPLDGSKVRRGINNHQLGNGNLFVNAN